MSTTVIDELILVLGLDASKFREGSRDAMDSLRRTRDDANKFGKDVEAQGMKLSDVFATVKKGALGLVAAFAGDEAVQFVKKVGDMDAATGRWAKTIGISVEGLSKWQYMIRQLNGDAGSATATLSALQQQIETVRQGGGMFETGFASLMNQAGVSIRDNADTSLRKIRAYLAGQVESGKMKPEEAATYLRRVPGMNQDMLNLLLQSTDAFNKLAEAVDKLGAASKKTAEAGAELQRTGSLIAEFWESVARRVLPAAGQIAGAMNKMMGEGRVGARGSLFDRFFSWMAGTTSGEKKDTSTRVSEGFAALSSSGSGGGSGGSRGNRNNNPGNIEYGPFARAHGATGSDGRFAIFPDEATGSAAQIALVTGSAYHGLTLDQFGNKYSEGAPAWKTTVGGALGIGPNDIVDNQDPRLIDAIRRAEGTSGAKASAGARVNNSRTSTSSSQVSIGKIDVHAPNATDADGIANEIGGAMRRQQLIAPANQGLQ
jgi:hypothetical protein